MLLHNHKTLSFLKLYTEDLNYALLKMIKNLKEFLKVFKFKKPAKLALNHEF